MNPELRKAMILAAGEGRRLRPLTLETPKTMLPVAEKPLLSYIIVWLKRYGIIEAAINIHHLGEKIKLFLGDGSRFGMRVLYSPEETLLGTAGGVKRIQHFFDSTFLVVYGDLLPDFNLGDMLRFHSAKRATATLALFKTPNRHEMGIVQIDGQGRLLSLVEKPLPNHAAGDLCNGGIYILEREVLDYIPEGRFADFACDIFPKLLDLGLPIYGYRLNAGNHLLDTGTMDKYRQVNEALATGSIKISYKVQGCFSGS